MPRNGRPPAIGAVEALTDNAHVMSMKEKIAYLTIAPVCEKRYKKRSDVELSSYDSDGIELHTGPYVPGLRYREKL